MQTNAPVAGLRVLTVDEAAKTLSISKSGLWRLMRAGRLPKPVQLTPNRVGVRSSDLERFIQELVA